MPHLSDIVVPEDLARVGGLQLLARGVVEGFVAGLHRSPHRGNSVEFKQHRSYVPGDDLRMLDWKIFGKTDRFFVREFEEETNLRATLLLDCSGSMAYGAEAATSTPPPTSKHDYAVRLAACLCYLMLRQQDGVALANYGQSLQQYVPVRSNARHLDALLGTLLACKPAGPTDPQAVFRELAPRLERRGLIIVISDCFGDVESLMAGLAHFKHMRHEVMILQVVHRDELEFQFNRPIRLDDLEQPGHHVPVDPALLRSIYLRRLDEWQERLAQACARQRIELMRVTTDEPYAEALRRFVTLRARGGRQGAQPADRSPKAAKARRRAAR